MKLEKLRSLLSVFIHIQKMHLQIYEEGSKQILLGSNNHSSLLILQGSIKKIGSSLKSFHLLQQTKGNSFHCLISYCGGAWHYRIFPDFLNSGFKMASKTEGKAKHEKIKFETNNLQRVFHPVPYIGYIGMCCAKRYVFFSRFGVKQGINFNHFGV